MILEGVKVLELASVLAGPSVGMFLAELGAEVTKVENFESGGDVTRGWLLPNEKQVNGTSSYFSAANWGKKTININLKKDREQLNTYLEKADIVLVSYKPGDATKFKLDYQSISVLNPKIIYGEITGYGQEDSRVAYDVLLQAEAGFMYLNRLPNQPYCKFPTPIVDIIASHQMKQAILAAYIKKLKTNEGSYLSVSLLDAAMSIWANVATAVLMQNAIPEPQGSLHSNIAPYGEIFKTSDEVDIIVAIGTHKQFEGLCQLLSLSSLAINPKFSTNQQRLVNRTELAEELQIRFNNIKAANFLAGCKEMSIPCTKIQTPTEAIKSYPIEKILKHNSFAAIPQLVVKGVEKQKLTPPPPML